MAGKRRGTSKRQGSNKSKRRGTKRRGTKNKRKNLVDIGVTRPRMLGQSGMNQNLAVSNALAKTMSQNRNMAQGLAQSQSLGMGQSLA
jgi:hypothetical protein